MVAISFISGGILLLSKYFPIASVVQPSSAFAESVTRSGLRTLIVASTIAVAISNPYFGAVLGVSYFIM